MATQTKPPAGVEPGKFYSFRQLAAATGLPWTLIRNMADDGRLKALKVGRERGRVIAGTEWLAYVEANTDAEA